MLLEVGEVVEAMVSAEQESSPQPNQFGFGTSSDINKLSRAWGIEMLPSKIVGDLQAATQISRGQNQVDRSIVWLSLRGEQAHGGDPVFPHPQQRRGHLAVWVG